MNLNIEPRYLVPVVIGLVLSLLRKYLRPAPRADKEIPFTVSELERFNRVQWRVAAAMLAGGSIFVFVAHIALEIANRYFANTDGPSHFQFLPSRFIWWFFPVFGGVSLTAQITYFLWAFVEDREKVRRYIEWGNERTGFEGMKALNWMAAIIAAPIGIVTILAVPMHSCLRDNDLVVGHFASLSSQHELYSQAKRMTVVRGLRDRDGKFTSRAGVVIDFSDGYRWNSANDGDFKSEVDSELVEFLHQKTGLPVEQTETEKEIPHIP